MREFQASIIQVQRSILTWSTCVCVAAELACMLAGIQLQARREGTFIRARSGFLLSLGLTAVRASAKELQPHFCCIPLFIKETSFYPVEKEKESSILFSHCVRMARNYYKEADIKKYSLIPRKFNLHLTKIQIMMIHLNLWNAWAGG